MAEIERLIADKEGKLDDYDLNWFILPPNMKSTYKTIKVLSLKKENTFLLKSKAQNKVMPLALPESWKESGSYWLFPVFFLQEFL